MNQLPIQGLLSLIVLNVTFRRPAAASPDSQARLDQQKPLLFYKPPNMGESSHRVGGGTRATALEQAWHTVILPRAKAKTTQTQPKLVAFSNNFV